MGIREILFETNLEIQSNVEFIGFLIYITEIAFLFAFRATYTINVKDC